jgi:hypothetical protein
VQKIESRKFSLPGEKAYDPRVRTSATEVIFRALIVNPEYNTICQRQNPWGIVHKVGTNNTLYTGNVNKKDNKEQSGCNTIKCRLIGKTVGENRVNSGLANLNMEELSNSQCYVPC